HCGLRIDVRDIAEHVWSQFQPPPRREVRGEGVARTGAAFDVGAGGGVEDRGRVGLQPLEVHGRMLARPARPLRVPLIFRGDAHDNGFPYTAEDDMYGQRCSVRRINPRRMAVVGVITAGLVAGAAGSAVAATTSAPATHTATASACLPAGHDDTWPAWTNG